MRFHNPAEVHLAKKKVEEGKKKLRIKMRFNFNYFVILADFNIHRNIFSFSAHSL